MENREDSVIDDNEEDSQTEEDNLDGDQEEMSEELSNFDDDSFEEDQEQSTQNKRQKKSHSKKESLRDRAMRIKMGKSGVQAATRRIIKKGKDACQRKLWNLEVSLLIIHILRRTMPSSSWCRSTVPRDGPSSPSS